MALHKAIDGPSCWSRNCFWRRTRTGTNTGRGTGHAERFGAHHFDLDGDGGRADVPRAGRGHARRRLRRRRRHRRADDRLPAGARGQAGRRARRRADRRRRDRPDHGPPGHARSTTASSSSSGSTARRARASPPRATRRPSTGSRRSSAPRTIDCDFERLDGYLFIPPERAGDCSTRELDAARRAGLRRGARRAGPARRVRDGPLPALPAPGAVPPAEVPRRPGRGDHARRRADLHGDARDAGRGRHAGAGHARPGASSRPTPWWWRPTRRSTTGSSSTPSRPPTAPTSSARASRPARCRAALYWDTLDPYHYVRLQRTAEAHELLIVGGEDHKTGQADDAEARFDRLEAWTRERFPTAGAIAFRWSGQVMEPVDGLAFIGRNPRRRAQRLHRHRRLRHGHDPRHDRRHAPDRPDPRPREPVGGALRPVAQARSAPPGTSRRRTSTWRPSTLDWVTPGDVASAEEIAPGTGAVVRSGLTKVAVYRDPAGVLHRALGGLPAPRLRRALEPRREDLGLPLPRLALRSAGQGPQRPGQQRPRASGPRGVVRRAPSGHSLSRRFQWPMIAAGIGRRVQSPSAFSLEEPPRGQPV